MTDADDAYSKLFTDTLADAVPKLHSIATSFITIAETVHESDPRLASLLSAGALCASVAKCLTGVGEPEEYAEIKRFLDETPDFIADLRRMVEYASRINTRAREQGGVVKKPKSPLLILPARYQDRWRRMSPPGDKSPGN